MVRSMRPSPPSPHAPAPAPAPAARARGRAQRRWRLIGWTFFDPANLLSLTFLVAAALLSLRSFQRHSPEDLPIAGVLYLCQLGLLRGYFFSYYHGGLIGRLALLFANGITQLGSAALWLDRSEAWMHLQTEGAQLVEAQPALRWAAYLQLAMGATLLIHLLLPRRWLMRATDELADRGGQDEAADAPIESINDPQRRAQIAAAREEAQAQKQAADEALVQRVRAGIDKLSPLSWGAPSSDPDDAREAPEEALEPPEEPPSAPDGPP